MPRLITTLPGTMTPALATAEWFSGVQEFERALEALGLVRAADPGQVTWPVSVLPANSTNAPGNSLWRFDDAEQAEHPVFLSFVFAHRTYTTSSNYVRIGMRVGTGTDGNGSLTGVLGPWVYFFTSTSSGSSAQTWYASGDGHGVVFAGSASPNTPTIQYLQVERLRDADGAIHPGMVYIASLTGSTATPGSGIPPSDQCAYTLDLSEGVYWSHGGLPIAYGSTLPGGESSLAMGNFYPFGQVVVPTRLGGGRSRLVVGYANNDFYPGTILTVPRFSSEEPIRYRTVSYGTYAAGGPGFGPASSTSNAWGTTHPYSYAAPAIYWEE